MICTDCVKNDSSVCLLIGAINSVSWCKILHIILRKIAIIPVIAIFVHLLYSFVCCLLFIPVVWYY